MTRTLENLDKILASGAEELAHGSDNRAPASAAEEMLAPHDTITVAEPRLVFRAAAIAIAAAPSISWCCVSIMNRSAE